MQPDAFAETQREPSVESERKGKPVAGSSQSMVGRVLKGQYRVEGLLGQGAMGVVFRGTQLQLSKPVAIKMLRPDGFHGDDALDRFHREATVVSKLNHPSIAQVLDFGVEEQMPFLVMEFVDGKELTEVLETEGPMPPSRAIAIVRQLASALEEAHKNGIVHRDIKPHNMRLMRYTPGGQVFLKVLDFGIAKQLGEQPAADKLTATGAVMGTPAYMAPEQAGGSKIDARADQYATGIVLYELLTGIVPFTGETLTGVLVSHLTQPPPPLPREVPEPLRKIVMRLLEKNPEARFPDAAAIDRALAACESACRDVPPIRLGKVKPFVAGAKPVEAGGRTLLYGGAALVGSLLLLGGVLGLGLKKRAGHVSPVPVVAVQPAPAPTPSPAPPPAVAVAPAKVEAAVAVPAANKPTAIPAPVATSKPTASRPAAHPTGTPATSIEPPEVKEKLDAAEALFKKSDFAGARDLAKRANTSGPSARGYRLLVSATCNMGDLEGAKTAFHRVAAADRRALKTLCSKHDIDLP